jgi:DNA gyrase subunit A
MQSSFAVNMLALVDGQPRTVSLKKILESFIIHRRVVIRRRSEYDLGRAKEREHILQGLLKALDHLDEVIQTIRRSESAEKAKERLMRAPFRLSDRQAQAVLDMQLRRLARLERQKIQDEFAEIIMQINYLEDLLANPRKIDYVIQEETLELKKKHGDDRRTQISERAVADFREEDLIPHQETVITISTRGYIKRIPLENYRAQRRGGRGKVGAPHREGDAVRHVRVADTHDNLLFFTDRGKVYQLRTYELPEESRQARGIPIINLIYLEQGEQVTAVVVAGRREQEYLVLATEKGEVKRTALSEYASVRRNGLITMDLEQGDSLVAARLAVDEDQAILVTARGQALRFPVSQLRAASRQSGGVRGVRLLKGDRVVGMDIPTTTGQLLVVTANGFGKRTPVEEYPTHSRGGQGVQTFRPNDKTGPLVSVRMVEPLQELMIISRNGIVLRTPVDSIASQGRATMGVTLMDMDPGDIVASITTIDLSSPPTIEPPTGNGAKPEPGASAAPTKTKAMGATQAAAGAAAVSKSVAGKPAKRPSKAAPSKKPPAGGPRPAGRQAAAKKARPGADRKKAGPRTRRAQR